MPSELLEQRMGPGPLDFAAEFLRLAAEGAPESTTELGGVAVRLVRVMGGGEG